MVIVVAVEAIFAIVYGPSEGSVNVALKQGFVISIYTVYELVRGPPEPVGQSVFS